MQLLYNRVAVKEEFDDEKFSCGLWRAPAYNKAFKIPGQAKNPDDTMMGHLKAKVIAVGKGKRLKNGKIKPMSVKVGDVVIVDRLAAAFNEFGKIRNSLYIKDFEVEDHKSFFMVREDDVLAIIK